jgi:DNA-binding transcriptional ArsR family regulator
MLTLSRKSTKLKKDEKQLIQMMQALGDATRFKMYKLMRSDNMMCVSEIAEALNVSVPAVSQHFRIFELVGLVDKKRNGQKICYSLKPQDSLFTRLNRLT